MSLTLKNQTLRASNKLEIVKFGETQTAATIGLEVKPTADSPLWQVCSSVMSLKHEPETEDDEITTFSPTALRVVRNKNTQVIADKFTLECAEMNELFWQIAYRVDSFVKSAAVMPFANSKQGVEIWARITRYNANSAKMSVLEVPCVLKVETGDENNKIIKPTVSLEVLASSLSTITPEALIGFAS